MAIPGTLSAASAEAEWSPPATGEMSTSGNSWHKRYVRNVTKGVSTLLWGQAKKEEIAHTPNSGRSVIDWCHITYPTKESIPTLDFHVSRKASICKRSRVSTNSSSITKAPMLHARTARILFNLSPPLMLETGGPNAAAGTSVASPAPHHHHVRNRSRWSVVSGSTGASTGGNNGGGENSAVFRCIEALGVLSVVPFGIMRTDLYGEVTHRVDFKVTHLLYAQFGEVLGIGETLVCVTAAYTLAVYRVRDLQLLYDISAHIYENLWMRYFRRHTRDPPSSLNDCRVTCLALSPSSFSRRQGIVALGSSSGLTHVWKIPDRKLVGILPPPISGQRQNVVGIGFSSSEILECIHDVASPFPHPETSDTMKRRTFILVLYIDGQASIWSVARDSAERLVVEENSLWEEEDGVGVGTIPPHLQFHYPSIEAPLFPSSHMRLERLTQWHSPDRNVTLETVVECGDCIALFVKVDSVDFGFIIIHPQSTQVVQPLIAFQDMGIPITVKNPAAVCFALLKNTNRCLVVATPGVLRVIRLNYEDHGLILDEQDNMLTYEMDFQLQLIATLPVSRKTEFCKAKYDADFDELLLGLTTGEVVRIDSFTDLVLRA